MRLSLILSPLVVVFSIVSPALSETKGSLSCTIDGAEWRDDRSSAFLTGENTLSLGTDDDKVEGILIMISRKPAPGELQFNQDVTASFADREGKLMNSKAGSGKVTITRFVAPEDAKPGLISGTFSGTFGSEPEHILSGCKFNMPVVSR